MSVPVTDNRPRRLSREEQRQRTRAELLTAAADVFAAKGFHAASVDLVAEAAGYTKGAVYSNFDSKEDLFLAVFESQAQDMVNRLDEIFTDAPAEDRIRILGEQRSTFGFFTPQWQLLEAEFTLYAARNEHLQARLRERQLALRTEVANHIVRHLDDLGLTTTVDPMDVARLIGAAGDGLTMQQLAEGEEAPDMGRLFSLLLELLLRGATS